MFYERLKAFLIASMIFLLLTFCDDLASVEEDLEGGTLRNFEVALVNDTALPLHIVGPNEQFGDGNWVGANRSRTYTVRGVSDRNSLSFRAGIFTELWVEVGHVSCVFNEDTYNVLKDDYLVVYHGVGSMTCDNW